MDETLRQLKKRVMELRSEQLALENRVWEQTWKDYREVCELEEKQARKRKRKFDNQLDLAWHQLREMERAYYDERVRIAKLGLGLPKGISIGNVFVHWVVSTDTFGKAEYRKTGNRVRIVVYDVDIDIDSPGEIEVGDIIAVGLLRSGGLSGKWRPLNLIAKGLGKRWHPEGVDPNVTESAA